MFQLASEPLLKLGLQHQQRGEFRQAEALFRQVLATDPNHPQALHLLGFLLGQTGTRGCHARRICGNSSQSGK